MGNQNSSILEVLSVTTEFKHKKFQFLEKVYESTPQSIYHNSVSYLKVPNIF